MVICCLIVACLFEEASCPVKSKIREDPFRFVDSWEKERT